MNPLTRYRTGKYRIKWHYVVKDNNEEQKTGCGKIRKNVFVTTSPDSVNCWRCMWSKMYREEKKRLKERNARTKA